MMEKKKLIAFFMTTNIAVGIRVHIRKGFEFEFETHLCIILKIK